MTERKDGEAGGTKGMRMRRKDGKPFVVRGKKNRCEHCGGTGRIIPHTAWEWPIQREHCPACNGTGSIVAPRVVTEPRDCPGCGRIMSAREAAEQSVCNDCAAGHDVRPVAEKGE